MSLKTEVDKSIVGFFSPLKDSKRALQRFASLIVSEIEGLKEVETKKRPVRIYRLDKKTPLPTQANDGDAGYDVYLPKDVTLEPGDKQVVDLGIICEAPAGYHFKLMLRSSAAVKRGLRQLNSVGIIDTTFCGPKDVWKLAVENGSHKTVVLKAGDRVAQMILEKNEEMWFDEQSNKNFAGKSRGGLGSTGE